MTIEITHADPASLAGTISKDQWGRPHRITGAASTEDLDAHAAATATAHGGLLPAGTTTAGVPDSTDRRYLTDAQRSGLTSGSATTLHTHTAANVGADPAGTASTAVASHAALTDTAHGRASRTIRILALGDSHTMGRLTIADDLNPPGSYVEPLFFTTLDEQWSASGLSSTRQDNAQIDVLTGGGTDVFTQYLNDAGSYINRIPRLLRRAHSSVGVVRTANVGVGGSSAYCWQGDNAYWYVVRPGIPTDGQTFTVVGPSGTKAYTWRASASVAYDLQIGASATASMINLVACINGTDGRTPPNPDVWMPLTDGRDYSRVYAKAPGAAGNSITIQASATTGVGVIDHAYGVTTSAVTLTLGADASSLYTKTMTALAAGGGFGTVDVVLVTLGTNDAVRMRLGNSPLFSVYFPMFLAKLKTDFPTAKIVLSKPPVTNGNDINTSIASDVNPTIDAAVAADPTRVFSLDMFGEGQGSGGTAILADGLHTTVYGAERWAQKAAWKIAAALGLN